MAAEISTHFPPLPPETLRGKAAHMTVALSFITGGVVMLWSAWDELTCVAGEATSNGPCGTAIGLAGFVFPTGAIFAVIGAIAVFRALRRRITDDGSDAWRIGEALVVIASAIVIALMVPRYACPAGTHLSPVFRFCTSADRSFPAPSPGLPWKFAAAGAGLVIGIVMIRWRSMPWWLASAVVVASFLGAVLFVASRSTGLPWRAPMPYTIDVAQRSAQSADQLQASPFARTSPNASAKWVGATTVPG
jgi:hypothetical protein